MFPLAGKLAIKLLPRSAHNIVGVLLLQMACT